MAIELRFEIAGIDWLEAVEIFHRAPLGIREPQKLKRACENSDLVCTAYQDGKLIGMGRALTDGEYQAAIYDLVVLPEYQRQGIGRMIMDAIHRRLDAGMIILYAVPGKEAFYEKLGYHRLLTGMGRRLKDVERFRAEGYIE
jgi:ribosomal protein S18 acetylase RimI-like enzyme